MIKTQNTLESLVENGYSDEEILRRLATIRQSNEKAKQAFTKAKQSLDAALVDYLNTCGLGLTKDEQKTFVSDFTAYLEEKVAETRRCKAKNFAQEKKAAKEKDDDDIFLDFLNRIFEM